MRRRALLGSLAATVGMGVAGCTGQADPAGDPEPSTTATATETTTRTQTETRTETRTATATRPAACPATLDLDVTKPDDLTAGSVEQFVLEYEEAYVHQEKVPDDAVDVFVDAVNPTATQLGAGYAVEVRSRQGWCENRSVSGTDDGDGSTPTETCVDGRATIVYYVDPIVVRRTREHRDEPRKGELLECA